MKIEVVKFLPRLFVELAVDANSGQKLLGVPFDHGGAGHTNYYSITDNEFAAFLSDDAGVAALLGSGGVARELYYSTFAAASL